MTTNPVTQTIRHAFVSNDAEAAAWSQLPEQITDALTREYVLTPRPAEPLIDWHNKPGRPQLTRNGEPLRLSPYDFKPATWRKHVADQEAAVEAGIAALTEYRAVLAYVEQRANEQDAKKQMADKIRHEQRHEALRRILPEAAAANNLPAWDDLDLLQQRAVDQVVDLTNVVNGGATPAEVDRAIKLSRLSRTCPPVYL